MRIGVSLPLAFLITFAANPAGAAPRKSTAAAVQLLAVVPESLTLQAAAPPIAIFPRGLTRPVEPITVTTRWNVEQSRSKVVVYAYFQDASGTTVRLDNVPSAIPAHPSSGPESLSRSMLYASGTVHCSESRSAASATEVIRQMLTPGVNDNSSRTDALQLLAQSCSGPRMLSVSDPGTLTFVLQAY